MEVFENHVSIPVRGLQFEFFLCEIYLKNVFENRWFNKRLDYTFFLLSVYLVRDARELSVGSLTDLISEKGAQGTRHLEITCLDHDPMGWPLEASTVFPGVNSNLQFERFPGDFEGGKKA